jgi:protein phosphatase
MSGKNNEDRYGVSAHTLSEDNPVPSVFAIVADGIGGHQAGEIAAEIAVETISHIVASSEANDPLAIMSRAIEQAGRAVHEQSNSEAAQKGMGSTCVCTWIIGDQLYTASIGDSRIYLIRDGAIYQLTTDHTWVQEAIEHGLIEADQARGHPQSHIIRRYLGSKKPAEADLRLRLHPDESDEQAYSNQGMELLPGDQLLLCSDGLSDLVDEQEILTRLLENEPAAALQQLVQLANERGGHDNITIVTLTVPSPEKDRREKGRSRGKLRWIVTAALLSAAILVITAVAIIAWQFNRSSGITPTPTSPQTTAPAGVDTHIAPVDTQEAPLSPPPSTPRQTPIRATYTPWPTSTQEP